MGGLVATFRKTFYPKVIKQVNLEWSRQEALSYSRCILIYFVHCVYSILRNLWWITFGANFFKSWFFSIIFFEFQNWVKDATILEILPSFYNAFTFFFVHITPTLFFMEQLWTTATVISVTVFYIRKKKDVINYK